MKKYNISELEESIRTIQCIIKECRDSESEYREEQLNFVLEVLQDVSYEMMYEAEMNESYGKTERMPFPYGVLQYFEPTDKPTTLTKTLRNFAALTGNRERRMIGAISVNKWLQSHGYIEKAYNDDIGMEDWCPTEAGQYIGIHASKTGSRGRNYMKITYDKDAQLFLAEHLEQIESEMIFGGGAAN